MKETEILKVGGVILYPTDTVWGLGCDATNEEGIKKILEIKGRGKGKHLLLLVKDEDMLKKYVEQIPDLAKDLLKSSSCPTTIIYPKAKNLPLHLLSENGSIGIRIPNHDYCQRLLDELNVPLVSTSANLSGMPTPQSFTDIDERIKNAVDYIAEEERENNEIKQPSAIFKIDLEGGLERIR
jgi:L-threonylcarbamoyladenylate synthase